MGLSKLTTAQNGTFTGYPEFGNILKIIAQIKNKESE
jgi:hypothetical protein